ncbi:ThiF family adenylyltransferase [Arhodomonas sp. SL1]|uniref:ThiF family adenylyltransferase n=1 Tax=Arhodomonas sp. SL1 TaxID=3425691 RepID=UPI003F8825E2
MPETDWPDALRREVSRICRWPAVNSDTLSVTTDESDRVHIGFDLKTERLLEPVATPIQEIEPITLVYRSVEAVGMYAPAVWSARPDFPREIGHINPTPLEHPASLCLVRAGLQAVYDRYGVDGVLDRLSDWFHDAKTGQLMKDGWEPVPMGEGQDARGGYFNIGFFQKLALNEVEDSGYRCGVARLLSEELGGRVVFLTPPVDLNDDAQVQASRRQIKASPKEPGIAAYVPWVFVWSDRAQSIERQLFGVWNSYGEIEAGLEGTAIDAQLPTAIMTALLELAGRETTSRRPVALLVGIWRPEPISASVFGMASEPEARRLEMRAYLLHCERHEDNPIDAAVPVQQLLGLQLPSREMLAFTSGLQTIAPMALLGYGALGSCVADFLLRAGIPKIAVCDNDIVEPHNLGRHNATIEDLYAPKCAHLDKLAGKITLDGQEIQREVLEHDVASLSDEDLTKVAGVYPFIIDATADERVRRRLAGASLPAENRLLRMEIFHGGRLGTLFLTGAGNTPNAIDLYYDLCARAVEDKAVEEWLRGEQAAGTSSEELVVGMGCASATTRMPKYLVAQHAAAFMPTIIGIQSRVPSPGFGINPLAQDGTPLGWRWFDYGGAVTVLEAADAPSWEVRLSPGAAQRLDELRLDHGEIEAGGYLYGGYDFVLKQLYVVAVSDVPPGTEQSAAAIELGPAGQTRLERRLARCAGGKVSLIGTWHSHPRSDSAMSEKDRRTMESFRDRDRSNGLPTLLVISSPEGNGAHLWV